MIRGRHGDCAGIQYILVATQQGREPGVSGVRQNLVEPRLFDWVPRFPSRTLLLAVAMAVGLAIMSTTGTLRIADAEQASSRPCANGVAVPDPESNPGLVSDCEALLVSGDDLAGSATLGWSVDTPITEWEGVAVEGTPNRVRRLYLKGKLLTGRIPASLGRLTNLSHLRLGDNDLSGEMPAEVGSLSTLIVLDLSKNQLTGMIPPVFGSLANLQALSLSENGLTGPIPADLGRLGNLRWLRLDDNQLTGEIPSELAMLPYLEELWLDGNQFTGCIPGGAARRRGQRPCQPRPPAL